MSKLVLKFLNLTEKLHLIIYQMTIVFTLFFVVVVSGASIHRFVMSIEEKTYAIVLVLSFLFSLCYKFREKKNTIFDKVLYCFLLLTSIMTLLMCCQLLYFAFTFEYGFNVEIFFFFFLLPIIFTWCNFYLIKIIIKKIRK